MSQKRFLCAVLVLSFFGVISEAGPTSVLEELREQMQSGVELDSPVEDAGPEVASDRMGPYSAAPFGVPAHISTVSNDQISNYLQSRSDSQPHFLSDAQILPVSDDSAEEDNLIFSDEDSNSSLEDEVLSIEEDDSLESSSKKPLKKPHRNKDVSVEVHIDSDGDGDADKYLFGASSVHHNQYAHMDDFGHGAPPGGGNDVTMELPPNWPPEFREPHKGSVDYVLIPMIMIGIIVPIFVVVYVVVGSVIVKLQPVSLTRRKKRSPDPTKDWLRTGLEILALLDDWTSAS